jgi:hypothetical protein
VLRVVNGTECRCTPWARTRSAFSSLYNSTRFWPVETLPAGSNRATTESNELFEVAIPFLIGYTRVEVPDAAEGGDLGWRGLSPWWLAWVCPLAWRQWMRSVTRPDDTGASGESRFLAYDAPTPRVGASACSGPYA